MRYVLVLVAAWLWSTTAAAADLTVTIAAPVQGARVGDSVFVSASVVSLFELKTVRAELGSQTVDLKPAGGQNWQGTLPLVGEPYGSAALTVRATDAFNTAATATIQVSVDRPPALSVTRPVVGEVFRPSARVTASCSDDAPAGCVALRVSVQGNELWRNVNSIDEDVELSARGAITLRIEAKDSAGQVTSVSRRVIVDPSPLLVQVARGAEGSVLHFDGARTLVLSADNKRVTLISEAGQETIIYQGENEVRGGWLINGGALVNAGGLFRWQGSLVSYPVPATPIVNGQWLGWVTEAGPVGLRNLSTGQEVLTYDSNPSGDPTRVNSGTAAVGPNGGMVWQRYNALSGFVLHRFDGTAVTVFSARIKPAQLLATDGVHVALTQNSSANNAESYAYDLSGTAVASCRAPISTPCPPMALNGGWIGYTSYISSTSKLEAHRRSPQGVHEKVSVFAANTVAEAIGGDGSVMMASGGKRYLTQEGTAPPEVATTAGTAVWIKGKWFLLMGCVVFRIDGVMAPDPGDAGTPMDDAGTPMEDAGSPMEDADTPTEDAGTEVSDAGGTGIRDAGTLKDGGAVDPRLDAGRGMDASGGPIADAAVSAPDAGRVPPPADEAGVQDGGRDRGIDSGPQEPTGSAGDRGDADGSLCAVHLGRGAKPTSLWLLALGLATLRTRRRCRGGRSGRSLGSSRCQVRNAPQ